MNVRTEAAPADASGVEKGIPWKGEPLAEGTIDLVDLHGLPALVVDVSAVRGVVFLQGAHVAEWTPAGEEPVLWMGPLSHYADGRPLRGGVPVCLPWFGAGADGTHNPIHGWARLRSWDLVSVAAAEDGGVDASLALPASGERPGDPLSEALRVRMDLHLGADLRIGLSLTNVSDRLVEADAALHAYWAAETASATVEGLDAPFLDRVTGIRHDAGHFPRVKGQTIDRLYAFPEHVALRDGARKREVIIVSTDAEQVVAWNPGVEGCVGTDDLGADDWRHFVCLEAVRAGDRAMFLSTGQTGTLTLEAHVEAVATGA